MAPMPVGGDGEQVVGVDCYSQNVCYAVGTVGTTYPEQGLVLKWKPDGWKAVNAPAAQGLGAISCVDGKDCVTLGYSSSAVLLCKCADPPLAVGARQANA